MDHVHGPLHILLVGKRGNPTLLVSMFFLSPFHSLFEFYIGEEGKESMMDHLERRGRILVVLALYWYLHMIVQHVLNIQALAFNGERENALILSIWFESMKMSACSVWAFEKNVGFTNWLLLSSFMKKCSSKELVYVIFYSS